MSEAKHTPGPWQINANAGIIYIRNNHKKDAIARIARKSFEEEANARLIAAAPELLKALKAIADDYAETIGPCSVECAHEDCRIVKNARTAIAKAEPQ